MDVKFNLNDKEKNALKKTAGTSLLAGAGAGIAAREVMRHELGLGSKVDPHTIFPFMNDARISDSVKHAAQSADTAFQSLDRVKMSPEELGELDKATLIGGAAGALGTLAAQSLLYGVGKLKKSYDKRAAERYNVQSAKNLALKEAGFQSEDEDYYEKSVVPVTKR